MLLADKIINLRKKLGWSQEELAHQLQVSRQAVSKWESGMSIPDMNKIIGMSRIFGVSTDYLLIDEIEEYHADGQMVAEDAENESIKSVSLEEANLFMDLKEKLAGKFAATISAYILSPVILIILAAFSEYKKVMSEELASGIGIVIFLLIVAGATAHLIYQSMKIEKYEYLEKEVFTLQYGVSGIVEKRRAEYEGTYHKLFVLGVALCIICPIPLLVAGAMELGDFVCILATALLLVIVSVGVFFIMKSSERWEAYQILLQEEDFTKEKKQNRKYSMGLTIAYWCVVVCIFFVWGFHTGEWGETWILWICSGILYAALSGFVSFIMHIVQKKK